MSLSHDPESVRDIVLYFQIHQPKRLRPFRFFDIGSGLEYFDEKQNREIIQRVAQKSYLPANAMLLKLIRKFPQIKITFSISGIALDQFRDYAPEVIESFRALAQTSSVEFLAETDHHSLACLIPDDEFDLQVLDQVAKLHEYFDVHPTVFRNTELIYSNELAERVQALGFNGIFADGIERILGNKSPHRLFKTPGGMKIFLRNYHLSDDIAFRYLQWGKTLTAEKYVSWLQDIPPTENLVTLGMDYETFGEHQHHGIIKFLESLLLTIAEHKDLRLVTPSEAMRVHEPVDTLSVPQPISWADREKDLSAWLGNDMQLDAHDTMVRIGQDVKRLGHAELLRQWRDLQTSDHFYYMCTKKNDDGNVHAYFSPYKSPYEAFINYMNVMHDFSFRVHEVEKQQKDLETAAVRSEVDRRDMHVPQWAMNLPANYDERR